MKTILEKADLLAKAPSGRPPTANTTLLLPTHIVGSKSYYKEPYAYGVGKKMEFNIIM